MRHFLIRLAEADRKMYDAPESMLFDFEPRVQEAFDLVEQLGIGWGRLNEMLFNIHDGEGKTLSSTTPDARLAAIGVVCWLAVRRQGRDVAWKHFKVDLLDVDWEWVDDPNPPAPDGASIS